MQFVILYEDCIISVTDCNDPNAALSIVLNLPYNFKYNHVIIAR